MHINSKKKKNTPFNLHVIGRINVEVLINSHRRLIALRDQIPWHCISSNCIPFYLLSLFSFFLLDCEIDLVFMVDDSGSISFNNGWDDIKSFVASIVNGLEV